MEADLSDMRSATKMEVTPMKKRVFALTLVTAMSLGLAACGSAKSTSTGSDTTSAADKQYTIGISQFAEHPSLDNCRNGFIEGRSEEHTSELQSRQYLVCRLLLEKKKK